MPVLWQPLYIHLQYLSKPHGMTDTIISGKNKPPPHPHPPKKNPKPNTTPPKNPNFPKLPVPEVLKLLGTLEKQTPSQNHLKPRKHTGSCYYCKCIRVHWNEIGPTGRCWRKRLPTGEKKRKNKEIRYTEKEVQLAKGYYAFPEIEATHLKNNASSFSSLKWDVRRKDLLRPFPALFSMKQRAIL